MGTEYVIVREQVLTGQTDMDKVLERLKVLIDSSTPIVVMETVEETRAVRMVQKHGGEHASHWACAVGRESSGSGYR